MTSEQGGTIACRILGICLLVLGLSSALYLLPLHMRSTSSWTSYPPSSASTAEEALHDSYYTIVTSAAWYYLLPAIAQAVAGTICLFFSRPLGLLLTRHLPHSEDRI
jgi:hypothetical protein